MRKILIISLLSTILGLLGFSCQSDESREVQRLEKKLKNLETFARLYGYARWFHPSDEAQEIDWEQFAVLGVQKVENIKSSKELRDTLFRLFSPIVQGLQIYEAQKPEIFNPEILLSPDPDAKTVAWQHHGVYLNDESKYMYKSIRTNKSRDDKNNECTQIKKEILNISHLRGKEVKFSGYFRSNKRGAKLYIQPVVSSINDKKIEVLVEDESQDWKKYELSLHIPKETLRVYYGIEIDGDVEVWADEFVFAVKKGGEWSLADTVNMGFENAKWDDEAISLAGWSTSMTYHTFEVTGENPFSGKYCLKINYTGKMFERMPKFGETVNSPIGNNLICVVPLTLLTNNISTWPETERSTIAQLQSELSEINFHNNVFDKQVNLASVIITWNILQHFFPYFDEIDVDWNAKLGETLRNSLKNNQKKDFFITMSRMFAALNDGHGIVFNEPMYYLPIRTEFIENKIVITASNDTALKRGDIIKKIDEKPAMKALDEKEKMIAGSPQLKRHRALNILGGKFDLGETMNISGNAFGSGKTRIVIDRDGMEQNVTVSNSRRGSMFFNPINEHKYLFETIVEIEPEIFYVNMTNCSEKEFEQKKDKLAQSKAVIYDQRGGSKLDLSQIIPYWITKPVTSARWDVPQTIYPDRKMVQFSRTNWEIQPKHPFFKCKSIIINVPSVVSGGETIMGIIDHHHLATTVGEPTAGCNGNINSINLPYGYYAWFTGMRVLKHDGSQLFLKGFDPDYPVNKTIKAIREGRDEYLEKALELARQE